MPELLAAALKYAIAGWPVFPCGEAGKKPIPNLAPHGCRDATTDVNKIRAWWSQSPRANIGFACGELSGISVIDIDVDKDKGENGWESLAQLLKDAGHANLPVTLTTKTPGSGGHYFYRATPALANKNDYKIGIDLRGDGYYVVLPPSIHPSGCLYEFVDPDVPVAELPTWLNLPRKGDKRTAPKPPPTPMQGAYTQPADVMQRASAYLAMMDAAVQGNGGHNRLYAACTAMVHGFDLSVNDARGLLLREYNPRCNPPWDMSNRKDQRDFDRKIDQADKQPHDQPRGWLLSESFSSAGGDAEHGAKIAAALLASVNRKPAAAKPALPVGLPDHLLKPGGLVGSIYNWIIETAYMPQPELTLANTLAFVGALIGRKVRSETDLRTNLYCLGVGESGCGKDHSRKQIKRLCREAGLTDKILGGEEVSSDVAILSAVSQRPTILFQFDEVGHMISAATSWNASSFQRGIPVMLTKLFSSASTTYLGREYGGKDRQRTDIEQPNVCIYGTTVPSKLYGSITSDEIRDGFLSRMLVFESGNPDPDPQPTKLQPVPANLIDRVGEWFKFTPPLPEGTGNLAQFGQPFPATVTMDSDAKRRFDAFSKSCRKHKAKVRGERGLDSLWARGVEHANKVALVLACNEPSSEIVIHDDIANYAIDLVEILIRNLVISVQDNVADTSFGRDVQKVFNVIKTAGSVTKSNLVRKTQGLTPRTRNEAISELEQRGCISSETVKGSRGSPATIYHLIDDRAEQ